MKQWVPTKEAYDLLHRGQIALSEIEAVGVRIDKPYLERALDETAERIAKLEREIRADPNWYYWQRRFREKANSASSQQLAEVVFKDLKYASKHRTASGARESASEKALDGIDIPLVKNYLEAQHLRKGRDTFLVGIQRELVQHADGDYYVHPSYHLNTVSTYRSSCSDPNFMQIPARNPMLAEMVRRCYIPRRGHQILEIDYGQIEVRIPCCYCFDQNLISYCCDSTRDMHRDVAGQLFFLDEKQAKQKDIRHIAKNMFVFPTIYGSYYAQMVPDIWEATGSLSVEGHTPLREWLRDRGITERGECDPAESPREGTFEKHVKEIEDHFWKERFPEFAQWKRDWLEAYQRDGGCRFLTGFVMTGPHAKNDITNWCIQGAAFHCTLWSLPKIVNRLYRYKMRTRVIGEIHDSIQFDLWPPERDAVIDMAVSIMTEEIKSWATWLNVPLIVEPEICPIDHSWFDKVGLRKVGKHWVPSDLTSWTKKYGEWV